VRSQVWSQVESQVESQVRSQVGSQVWSQVESQVRSQVESQNLEVFGFAAYGSIWDYGWVAFYEYFKKIGIVKLELFNNFLFLLKSGIYDMLQFEKVCIVSDMPINITRDSQNRLHNTTGYAIEWADGYGQYHVNGVAIKNENIVLHPEKLTKKDWMAEENTEVRRIIQEQMGERFVKEIKGKLINKGTKAKLYEVDINPDPERIAKYLKVMDLRFTSRRY